MCSNRKWTITALTNHRSTEEYRPEDYYPNAVNADGQFLGTYIPYIGERYFDTKPQLLIYAISQNLARTPRVIKAWHNNNDKGLLRQYYHPEKLHASITPYDDGHLKVIAALVLSKYPDTDYIPSDNIHEKIAVTNFVKFSFYQEGKNGQTLDANPPLTIYDDMWKHYSAYEIELLQPDIIIGVGKDATRALRRNLNNKITLLKIPFPGRLNLNSRYVPKGKRLIKENSHNKDEDIARIQALVQGTPDKDGAIAKAISTDWYYFREMESYISRNLASQIPE